MRVSYSKSRRKLRIDNHSSLKKVLRQFLVSYVYCLHIGLYVLLLYYTYFPTGKHSINLSPLLSVSNVTSIWSDRVRFEFMIYQLLTSTLSNMQTQESRHQNKYPNAGSTCLPLSNSPIISSLQPTEDALVEFWLTVKYNGDLIGPNIYYWPSFMFMSKDNNL